MKAARDIGPMTSLSAWASRFDNVNMRIFDHPNDWSKMEPVYCKSVDPPERRYGISPKKPQASVEIALPEGAVWYDGPNERYLIDKIINTPALTLSIVGGIGSGKTTFAQLFVQRCAELRCAACSEPGCGGEEPIQVLVDFGPVANESITAKRTRLESGPGSQYDAIYQYDETAIRKRVSEYFLEAISHRVEGRFYSLEEEVTEVWDAIFDRKLNAKTERGGVFGLIHGELHQLGALDYHKGENLQLAIKQRSEVRATTLKTLDRKLEYFAEFLGHIRREVYGGLQKCCIVIIDNVDGLPAFAQQILVQTLRPFFSISKVRGVIVLRTTTFRKTIEDAFQEVSDKTPYCGPDPVRVTIYRIERFLENPDDYLREKYEREAKAELMSFFSHLKDVLQNSELVRSHLKALSGFSIRKALVLAQSFLINHHYEPLNHNRELLAHRIVRSLVCQGAPKFSWEPRGVVDNLFWVYGSSGRPYLLKTRLLRMIRQEEIRRTESVGVLIRDVISHLSAFGYSQTDIANAICEMELSSKRLVWSDSTISFELSSSIVTDSGASLFLSQAGRGYVDLLFKSRHYIGAVLTDVPVEEGKGPGNFDSWDVFQATSAVFQFIVYLNEIEVNERDRFLASFESDDPDSSAVRRYEHHNGTKKLLSHEIAESCLQSAKRAMNRYENWVKGSEIDDKVKVLRDIWTQKKDRTQYFEELVNRRLVKSIDQPFWVFP